MIKNVKIKIKRYLYIKYCNIMNYDKIINEEIDRFINETFFTEKKKKKSKDEPRDIGKKAKKLKLV